MRRAFRSFVLFPIKSTFMLIGTVVIKALFVSPQQLAPTIPPSLINVPDHACRLAAQWIDAAPSSLRNHAIGFAPMFTHFRRPDADR